jgi:ABC-type Fe3+-siderophore transport system permease subunit
VGSIGFLALAYPNLLRIEGIYVGSIGFLALAYPNLAFVSL